MIKMKNMKKFILTIIVVLSVGLTFESHAQNIRISFDTTITNAPMVVHGKLDQANILEGAHIILIDSVSNEELFNDTLFFITDPQSGGSVSKYQSTIKPFKGIRFYHTIPLVNSNSGMLDYSISLLYIGGQVGEVKKNKVKK